jgi:hypothetical protein
MLFGVCIYKFPRATAMGNTKKRMLNTSCIIHWKKGRNARVDRNKSFLDTLKENGNFMYVLTRDEK